jgi:hypothetical protein
MVFPRRKRASDLDGGRFWHPQIEMRPLKWLGRTKRNAARTRINSATSCSRSFVGAGLSIRSSSRRTTMLLRVTPILSV